MYTLVLAYTQYAILFVDYGFGFTATRQISQGRASATEVGRIFSITVAAKLMLVCVSVITSAVMFLSFRVERHIWAYGAVSGLAILGNAIYPIWLYQGIEKMGPISIATVGARAVITISTFLFIKSPRDIFLALLISSFTFLLPGIALFAYALRRTVIFIYIPTWRDIFVAYRSGFPLFASSVATSFYTTFNTIILGVYSPVSAVGSYGAADKVRVAAQGLFLPFTQAIFPKICAQTNDGEFLKVLKKYGVPFLLFAISMSLCIAIFGKKLAILYFGSRNSLAADYFQRMAAIPAIVGAGVVFGQWYMVARGYSKNIGMIYVGGSCVHLIYALPVIRQWGALGVIYSVVLTQFFLSAAMFLFFIKKEVWGKYGA